MDDGLAIKLGIAFQFDESDGSDDEIPVLDMEGGDEKVTKKQLCREIARVIPGMNSRIHRMAEEKRKEEEKLKEEEETKRAIEAAQKKKNTGSTSNHPKKPRKKKGKK